MISPNTELVFWFFRHGQCVINTKPERIGGRSAGSPLTSLGVKQANSLGSRLAAEKIKFDEIYSSPLVRVVQTVLVVCPYIECHPDKVIFVPQLEELDQGEWEGEERDEIFAKYLKQINYLGPWFRPPGGESQKMVQRRISSWFEKEFLDSNNLSYGKKLNFGILGSGTVLKCLFQGIMGFNDSMSWKVSLDNCSISRFRFNERGWFIDCINDTGHLLGLLS